jgi:hypothetical protein
MYSGSSDPEGCESDYLPPDVDDSEARCSLPRLLRFVGVKY